MHLFNWFGFWLFVLYSFPVTKGQSQLICSSQPIVAKAGDDVILPCRLDPPISASSKTVEWTKPGLDPEYIHLHQDGRLVYQNQNPLYNYRTTVFVDQLINGNVSLKLFRVKTSDAGKYRCFLPSLWKEAFIQLTVEDVFTAPSNCTPSIAISVVFAFLFILTVLVLLVWTWRQHKTERKKREKQVEGEERSREQLMAETKRKEGLNEVCQMTEEEQKCMTQVIETLTELTKGLERQKEQLTVQMKEAERVGEENEKKVQSVQKEVTEKEGDKTANKAQGYFKLEEILTEIKWSQEERKKGHQELNMNTDKLMKSTMDEVNRIKEMRDKLENKMQQIKKQMQETENGGRK